MKFQRLRGFKDVLGPEAEAFARLEAAAREVFGAFGFQEIRVPVLEPKELFARALGDQTDVVQKEMYEFTDRSRENVALRPEGTAGVVRAYLENNLDKTQGLAKLYYLGPMFRSERPQAGRLRQFHQIGVEQLGTSSPYADAETIQCLAFFLDRAGLSGYRVKLNNLGTFEERDAFKKVLAGYFKPHQKELCEDCQNRLVKNVFRLLDCKVTACRELAKKSPLIGEHLSEESKAHFKIVLSALKTSGVAYEPDPTMVRGLDYYTKTVFEVTHPELGSQDAVAAGGRYDRLIETFGGAPAGAVGFAAGVERLLMVAKPVPTEGSRGVCFIVTLGDAASEKGFELLSALRKAGVGAAMDFSAKSMKSQMRSADKYQGRYALILGDNELAKKIFVLKDMKDGVQTEHPLADAVSILKEKAFSKC